MTFFSKSKSWLLQGYTKNYLLFICNLPGYRIFSFVKFDWQDKARWLQSVLMSVKCGLLSLVASESHQKLRRVSSSHIFIIVFLLILFRDQICIWLDNVLLLFSNLVSYIYFLNLSEIYLRVSYNIRFKLKSFTK